MLAKDSDVDVIGHLDLMKRYAYENVGNYNFTTYKEIIISILQKLIERNIGIEINTSGLRNSVKEIFPAVEILKLYKELGGDIITIGSDAHSIKDIGSNYWIMIELLKYLQFKYIFKFEKRKPIGLFIE